MSSETNTMPRDLPNDPSVSFPRPLSSDLMTAVYGRKILESHLIKGTAAIAQEVPYKPSLVIHTLL